MRRLRIYISGPLGKGDLADNINNATDCFYFLYSQGFAPLCPHWSAFATEAYKLIGREGAGVFTLGNANPHGTTAADWMQIDLPWVEVAEALLRLPGESAGSDQEEERALSKGIPVFYHVDNLIAWRNELQEGSTNPSE